MSELRIPSVTRVEGHGNIAVRITDGVFQDITLEIPEGPRLFETLVRGKTPAEVLTIVPRICAICNVSHRYSALRTLEKLLGVEVPPEVVLLRNLVHYGEMIESHTLHLFFLALPDFLGAPDAIALLATHGPVVAMGLGLKKFGNRLMELVLGRMIHGENPVIGGFGRFLTRTEIQSLHDEAQRLIPDAVKTWELFQGLDYSPVSEAETGSACLKPPVPEYGFWGDEMIVRSGDSRLVEVKPVEEFWSLMKESVVPHSTAKWTLYRDAPYVVGANARIILLGERLAGEAGTAFNRSFGPRWTRNPLFNNIGQAIEVIHCLEMVVKTTEQLLAVKQPPALVPAPQANGSAAAAVEAPRGTLFHSYEFQDGVCTGANLVIPTAQNYNAIQRHLAAAARKQFTGTVSDYAKEKLELEMVVRAYDPCISCSCHIVEL